MRVYNGDANAAFSNLKSKLLEYESTHAQQMESKSPKSTSTAKAARSNKTAKQATDIIDEEDGNNSVSTTKLKIAAMRVIPGVEEARLESVAAQETHFLSLGGASAQVGWKHLDKEMDKNRTEKNTVEKNTENPTFSTRTHLLASAARTSEFKFDSLPCGTEKSEKDFISAEQDDSSQSYTSFLADAKQKVCPVVSASPSRQGRSWFLTKEKMDNENIHTDHLQLPPCRRRDLHLNPPGKGHFHIAGGVSAFTSIFHMWAEKCLSNLLEKLEEDDGSASSSMQEQQLEEERETSADGSTSKHNSIYKNRQLLLLLVLITLLSSTMRCC
eukprot:GSA25T00018582001.1